MNKVLFSMGVPKFFRYMSERYPCLSELIKDHKVLMRFPNNYNKRLILTFYLSQIPEFDNLYLDMNGIIHNCSHPNDDDPHFRISEETIVKNIFHYLDVKQLIFLNIFICLMSFIMYV